MFHPLDDIFFLGWCPFRDLWFRLPHHQPPGQGKIDAEDQDRSEGNEDTMLQVSHVWGPRSAMFNNANMDLITA